MGHKRVLSPVVNLSWSCVALWQGIRQQTVSGLGSCAQGHCILFLPRPFTMTLPIPNQKLEMDTSKLLET